MSEALWLLVSITFIGFGIACFIRIMQLTEYIEYKTPPARIVYAYCVAFFVFMAVPMTLGVLASADML